MQKKYASTKLEKLYNNPREMQKKFTKEISIGMMKFDGLVDAATSAYDIMVVPQFHMHLMHLNYKGYYSVSLDNKKTKYRMLVKCLNENEIWVKPGEDERKFLESIKLIELGEMSEHYGN